MQAGRQASLVPSEGQESRKARQRQAGATRRGDSRQAGRQPGGVAGPVEAR
jgi:hypothetical protein